MRGNAVQAASPETDNAQASRPLLKPPGDGAGPVEVCSDCPIDLDLPGVPTISVIGPSRRGKSVLACLLAGGSPSLFAQSHSSFKAMTSGTHVCEVLDSSGELPLRIVDTEGLSHIGRSRKSEALVRQFLISTYLTSSWIIWLDTEVLSSSFFNTMWMVHDYVVDVLQIKEGSGRSLPGLIYLRTQETDVQRLEYCNEFTDFSRFFSGILEEHEDAHILTQMFAPGRIYGHSLPVWTVDDLEIFGANKFWLDSHASPFKDGVETLCDLLGAPIAQEAASEEQEDAGPPLLALSALATHLPKIARLEKFDPRDHEATKVSRLRAQLRTVGWDPLRSPLWLADLFDPEDKDVRQHAFKIDDLARVRIEKMCEALRLDIEVAEADPDVIAVHDKFSQAARIFDAAMEAFGSEEFSEKKMLLHAICDLRLDASVLAEELWASFAKAEEHFLLVSGLPRSSLKELRLHQQTKWRIEDAIQQLRGRSASELQIKAEVKGEFELVKVWRLGEWPGLALKRGSASKARRPEYALWTDGTSWKIFEEKWLAQRGGGGFTIGAFFEEGQLMEEGLLPLP